ncbi:MAG: pectinesterase family protein [Nitrososphaeria archaeon]|nr:pectinesterase family protein [Nitrososphaeria archaeon]
MKQCHGLKFFSITVVCVLIIISLIPFCMSMSNKIFYVPDNFKTIQEAIDKAPSGSTIVVRDGFYRENIVIDIDKNDLTIKSEHGPKNTIICNAANESEAYIVEIMGDRIVFEGFTIINDKEFAVYGIKIASLSSIIRSNIIKGLYINTALILDSCRNLIIENNTLRETYNGISVDRSSYCRIANNLIIGMQGYGIRFRHNNDNIVVEGNDISTCLGDGINIGSLANGKIVGNVITGCVTGIRVESPGNAIYLNNFVANNQHVVIQLANTTWNSEPLDYIYDLKKYHGRLGNFWDNYKGVDNNHDGVGDTPYKISEAQYDRYPLMQLIKDYQIITLTTTPSPTPTTTPSTTTTTYTTPYTTSTTPKTSPSTTYSQTITSPSQPSFEGLEITIIVVIIIMIIISLIVFSKVRRKR